MSTFRRRYECFKSTKTATLDYAAPATTVNRRWETANLKALSADDVKCLVLSRWKHDDDRHWHNDKHNDK